MSSRNREEGSSPDRSPGEDGPNSYVKAVERLLLPDEQGMVRKDRLVNFLERTLGSVFTGENLSELFADLECDENNNIKLECFLKTISERFYSEETLTEILDLLESSPEEVEETLGWRKILSNAGLDLSDDVLKEAVQAAKCLAEVLLTNQQAEKSTIDGECSEEGQIFQAVKEKIHLMGLGGECESTEGTKDSIEPRRECESTEGTKDSIEPRSE